MYREPHPPLWAVWLLRLTHRIVPAAARTEWGGLWMSRLAGIWSLADRGELQRPQSQTARLCGDAIRAAFFLRFERGRLLLWIGSASFTVAVAGAALALLAILSRGFQATRSVFDTALDWYAEPPPLPFVPPTLHYVPRPLHGDPRADLVVATFIPILLALAMGISLVVIGRLSVGRYGWRYWLYLGAKLAAVMTIVPLIWVEGNAPLRAHLPISSLSLAFGWIAWTLAFLGAFGIGVIWSFADQRQRCPVCLGRLALPVTFGSWASVLEPVITELLCDRGHGALSMDESELGPGDRWTTLDSSWHGL